MLQRHPLHETPQRWRAHESLPPCAVCRPQPLEPHIEVPYWLGGCKQTGLPPTSLCNSWQLQALSTLSADDQTLKKLEGGRYPWIGPCKDEGDGMVDCATSSLSSGRHYPGRGTARAKGVPTPRAFPDYLKKGEVRPNLIAELQRRKMTKSQNHPRASWELPGNI
eukprot:gnl/MRDRNA2_/MRDRNA2_35882_c0_seq1.p1 gnl/MRDRNA2_/MRDRNA2_35882_c0~~gnl/MRDRNA2_/MRDRNA2_35882_c0_seq1.p1  ORF type:complete len:165 (+),score=12.57 gnl/MRDRNA2_/MRDRNA2_35882_c0_seq1:71-565(+)